MYDEIIVDILMATYNGDKFINEQINSILAQTHQKFNLIIYDDCSSDRTREILYEYQRKDSRIKLIFGTTNIGSTKAFEILYNQSNADYFLFCDQDDVWNLKKIEKLLNEIITKEKLIVFSDLSVVDEYLNIIDNSFISYMNYNVENIHQWKKMIFGNVAPGCSMIISKKIKQDIKLFLECEILHDWWLMIIASFRNSIEFLPEPLVLYRQHSNNQVGAKKIKKIEGNLIKRFIFYKKGTQTIFINIIKFIKINNLMDEFSYQIEFMENYNEMIKSLEYDKGSLKRKFFYNGYIIKNSRYLEKNFIKILALFIVVNFPKSIKKIITD